VREDINFFLEGTGEPSSLAFEKYPWNKYISFNQYIGFTEKPDTYCLYIGQTTETGKHVYIYYTKGGHFSVKTSEGKDIGITDSWPEICEILDTFYKKLGMVSAA
jgi:hypothetical protein